MNTKNIIRLMIVSTVLAPQFLVSVAHAMPIIIADYSFNDGTAADQSGNGNDATVFGATLTADRFGNLNSAFLFNGSTDYIQTPVNSNIPIVSFSVWFRNDSSSGERSIVDSDVAGRFGQSLIIDYAPPGNPATGNLDVQFHNGSTDTGDDGRVIAGEWQHAVVNFASTLEVFLNNNLVLSQAYTPPSLDGSNFRIGRHNANDPQWFLGAIDDVRFYSTALTAADVNSLNSAGLPGNTVPEPSSIALLLAGFGALRFKRKWLR